MAFSQVYNPLFYLVLGPRLLCDQCLFDRRQWLPQRVCQFNAVVGDQRAWLASW